MTSWAYVHNTTGSRSLQKVDQEIGKQKVWKCPRWFTPNCISKPSSVFQYGQANIPALLIIMSSFGSLITITSANSKVELFIYWMPGPVFSPKCRCCHSPSRISLAAVLALSKTVLPSSMALLRHTPPPRYFLSKKALEQVQLQQPIHPTSPSTILVLVSLVPGSHWLPGDEETWKRGWDCVRCWIETQDGGCWLGCCNSGCCRTVFAKEVS